MSEEVAERDKILALAERLKHVEGLQIRLEAAAALEWLACYEPPKDEQKPALPENVDDFWKEVDSDPSLQNWVGERISQELDVRARLEAMSNEQFVEIVLRAFDGSDNTQDAIIEEVCTRIYPDWCKKNREAAPHRLRVTNEFYEYTKGREPEAES